MSAFISFNTYYLSLPSQNTKMYTRLQPSRPRFSVLSKGFDAEQICQFSSFSDPLPIFSAGRHYEQFWYGQGCPLFDVVYSAFPLPIKASPNLQGAMKDGFGEAVVPGDMPEPCKSISLRLGRTGWGWGGGCGGVGGLLSKPGFEPESYRS